ncbi:MAG: hypothetical protein KFW21_02660 [Spirochaetota bacterium]|nr:hypothetical protein [Spirochaetota bacterium]
MKRKKPETSINKTTREDFILDKELFEYYHKNYNQSSKLSSLPKIKLMKNIYEYQQHKKFMHILVTSLSVAVIIFLVNYTSGVFIIESEIEKNIPFVD